MGTILFLIFRAVKFINTPHDAIILCFLISLDSLVALQLYQIIKKK